MKLSELFHNCAYDVDYKQVGDSVNYAFVEDISSHTLYIYFQGSNSISDWVRNFLFPSKPYKDMDISYRVHRGFLAAWKTVEDIIIDKIKELDKPLSCYKWKHIVIVGYSHGGALAGFCHECVWFWRPDLREKGLEGYGFESPRFYAGWKVKKELRERWKTFRIIRTNNDLVTHCPPWLFRFCHVSNILEVKGDTSLVKNRQPKCIKSHFPQVVYDALVKWEDETGVEEYLEIESNFSVDFLDTEE